MPGVTPAVKVLLWINGGVFILNFILGGWVSGFLAVSFDRLWDGYGAGLLRLVGYQFAHSYESPFHILMNMLMLWLFGGMVEQEVGKRGMLRLYLIAGLVGALGHMGLTALLGDARPVIGASGAVYGIMLYAACMAPRMKVIFIMFPVQLRYLVGGLVFLGLYSTVLELRSGTGAGGVSHGAHLGGALWGYLAFRYFRKTLMVADPGEGGGFGKWLERWRRTRQHKIASQKQEAMDGLLDKVHRSGMSSLSGAERRFMERASRDLKRK